MYNVNARGVVVPNAVIGMACFVGGLAQVLAGMWGTSPVNLSLWSMRLADHAIQNRVCYW